MIWVNDDETLDEIRGIRIIQKKNGYRFSADSLLLADFADLSLAENVADIGTGSGVIAILMAGMSTSLKVTGIELQRSLYEVAKRNVDIAGLGGRIELVNVDIREIGKCLPADSFDLIVSNPPYYEIGKGRIGPVTERNIARHELELTILDLVDASAYLLKNGGLLAVVYPPGRITEAIAVMRSRGIGPRRIREAHSGSLKVILLEGEKGYSGNIIEEPYIFF